MIARRRILPVPLGQKTGSAPYLKLQVRRYTLVWHIRTRFCAHVKTRSPESDSEAKKALRERNYWSTACDLYLPHSLVSNLEICFIPLALCLNYISENKMNTIDSPTALIVITAIAVHSIVSPIPEFPPELYIFPYITANIVFFSYLLTQPITYAAIFVSLMTTNTTFILTSALLTTIRRLFFFPLTKFPGPKLAAISGLWNAQGTPREIQERCHSHWTQRAVCLQCWCYQQSLSGKVSERDIQSGLQSAWRQQHCNRERLWET